MEQSIMAEANEEDVAAFMEEMQEEAGTLPASASAYKHEFLKLLDVFTKSQESEKRLTMRGQELVAELQSSEAALQRDKEDETAAALQRRRSMAELEAIQQQVALANESELEKKNRLSELRKELAALEEEVSSMHYPTTDGSVVDDVVLTSEQESQLENLKKQRGENGLELEAKTQALQDLRREVSNLYDLVVEDETRNANLLELDATTAHETKDKQKLTERQARRKAGLERELRVAKQNLESLMVDIQAKEKTVKEGEESLSSKDKAMREAKHSMEKYLKDYDSLFRTTHSLTEAMQGQWQKNVELEKLNKELDDRLSAQDKEVEIIGQEAAKIEALVAVTTDRLKQVEHDRTACEDEKAKLKMELTAVVNGELETENRQVDIASKRLDEMRREREVLNKMIVRAQDRSQATKDLCRIRENTLKNVTNEINGIKSQVKSLRGKLQTLAGDRDKYENEAQQASQKLLTAMEESKLQDIQVQTLQLKITESESRLKQQQSLYESVRADRNAYNKQLVETQAEMATFKRQFKMLQHQIEQLKEEITAKDHALVKEHFEHHRVDKERELLKNELLRIRKQITSSEQLLTNQEAEVAKLSRLIQEAEEEAARQKKELKAVLHDRDALRRQLMQRHEELRALYEKLKIQQSTLGRGRKQFEGKREEVKNLQKRIQTLTKERDITGGQLQHEDSLQRELVALEKELMEEKSRIRALSEELDRPMNVHRWRKLEGSDPARMELIKKLQRLQRDMLKKHDEVTSKDLMILEKEKLYVELRAILARQPGGEVAQQVDALRQTLRSKKDQMRRMEDDRQLYKRQVDEYRREIEKLQGDKHQVITSWIENQIVVEHGRVSNNEVET